LTACVGFLITAVVQDGRSDEAWISAISNSESGLRIEFTSSTGTYNRILTLAALAGEPWRVDGINLGAAGTQTWTDVSAQSKAACFYKTIRSSTNAPFDQDGDLVDDVAELGQGSDPLDPDDPVICSRAVIEDRPARRFPSGCGHGLTVDRDSGRLMLRTDMREWAFVLEPDPDKAARPNTVSDLAFAGGKLFVGYGDIINNRGPVDIVSYDPLSNVLVREMENIPEEQVGSWQVHPNGHVYAGGQDSKESHEFGSFYFDDGCGWQKRRTIYKGLHVYDIVELDGWLFAGYSSDGSSPVPYPFILASTNRGASWFYHPVDEDPVDTSSADGLLKVPHSRGDFVYATAFMKISGGDNERRLYRVNTTTAEVVSVTSTQEVFSPRLVAGCLDKAMISGYFVFSNGWSRVWHAEDGQTNSEVPFLYGRDMPVHGEHDGSLYAVVQDEPYDAPQARYGLYRTDDLDTWESIGPLHLLPGARPLAMCFGRGRPYLGAGNAGWWDISANDVELWTSACYPIAGGSLVWDADVPAGSQLSLQIVSSTNYSDCSSQPKVGDDGTTNTVFSVSGTPLHSQHEGDVYFRLTIHKEKNGSGEWPLLRWVSLQNSDGAGVTQAVDRGQGVYTACNSTNPAGAACFSPTYSLDAPIAGGSIFFDGTTPDGTTLRFQVRSAHSPTTLASAPFVGPDGTAVTFYQTNGQALWSGHDGDSLVQYKAILSSATPTLSPSLRKVVLVTRAALDHFDIEVGATTWEAGQPCAVTATARTAGDALLPITGKVSLSTSSGGCFQPHEIPVRGGTGTAQVALCQSTSTWLSVTHGAVSNTSAEVTVLASTAAVIDVATDLPVPGSHRSPDGYTGVVFNVTMTVRDSFRNVVTGYVGTVECWRWSWTAHEKLFDCAFDPTNHGVRSVSAVIAAEGEWNLVCSDADTGIAGSLTVDINP